MASGICIAEPLIAATRAVRRLTAESRSFTSWATPSYPSAACAYAPPATSISAAMRSLWRPSMSIASPTGARSVIVARSWSIWRMVTTASEPA